MRRILTEAALLVLILACAHGLAFFIMRTLPDSAVAALGVQSAQPEARAAFEAARPVRDYGQVIGALAVGDLGTTLDGTAVSAELRAAARLSLPRLAAAIALIAAAMLAIAYLPRRLLLPSSAFANLFAFLPPFVAPFVGFGALLAFGGGSSTGAGASFVAIACLAAPAAAFAAAQASAITARNLSLPFAVTLRAVGASRARQRTRLLRNLVVELAPSLQKLAVGLLTSLLFVESIFGLGGIGTLLLRATRRNDADMVLALVLAIALAINLLRILSTGIRRNAGLGLS
jgi:peptide/nickel transport system permease protein